METGKSEHESSNESQIQISKRVSMPANNGNDLNYFEMNEKEG